ncbi:MAG: type I-C CRISPR-associated protein Cas8c/Csd1 [Boseongicola sp. SB0662_bin_57]|nr:type I-C CRISPR-associated protein Cas8c/Csd1 [Boseongicola sp. SB0662_bin_57]
MSNGSFLHDLPAARALLSESARDGKTVCLVTGRRGTLARLHPAVKGVAGAQSSGALLVSFNNAAETSHGKEQGENAPVSETAAFEYGTALNALLAQGSGNSMRVGGDTVAFWADQPEAEPALEALLVGAESAAAESELRARVEAVAAGRMRADEILDPEARLFVLGLAPNSARLAVRYWHPGTLRGFARAVTDFWSDCAIQPSPFVKDGLDVYPKPRVLLHDLAARRDAKNVPDGLGGDLMRAILTGNRYPATLLSAVIGRIRIEGEPDYSEHGNVDGRRAAMLRAILRRNCKQEVPMALDERATDTAYLLGRLFGAYTYAERSCQVRGAGLRRKYIGAASARPARIFPVLMRGYENNLAALLQGGGLKSAAGVRADRAVASVLASLPGDGDLPATLPLEAQGRFFVGFYHQVSAFYAKAENAAQTLIDGEETEGEAG